MTINKLTDEADPREMLAVHDVKVRVTGWNVIDGVYKPTIYTMETKDGRFEKRVKYNGGRWSKWHKKKVEPGYSGYYSVGGMGHWRLCGHSQEKLLAMLFTCAHRLGVIVDENRDKQNYASARTGAISND